MTFSHLLPSALFPIALLSAVGSPAPAPATPPSVAVIEVGDRRQVFVDRHFLESSSGVELQVHPPRKSGERNVVPDRPWEQELQSGSVVKVDGIYHLWYSAMEKLHERGDDFDGVRVAYARSTDGVHWEKPDTGIADYHGNPHNNIVLGYGAGGVAGGINGQMVTLDPHAPPSERFLMTARSDSVGPGLHVFTSGDGIHFTLKHRSVLKFHGPQAHLDTKNVILWDGRLGRYVAYVRKNLRVGGNPDAGDLKLGWNPRKGARIRTVARAESDGLESFADVEDLPVVLGPDALDPGYFDRRLDRYVPYYDYYTADVVPYPWAQDAYFLFSSGYYHFIPDVQREFAREFPTNAGVLDIRFAASRDGIAWQRYDREPFVPLGAKGEFDSKRGYMVYGIVPGVDDRELYLYYMGTDQAHGWGRDERNDRLLTAAGLNPTEDARVITRLVIRRDGFISASGAYTGGTFTTPLLRFAGAELVLNVDTSAGGEARVGLCDADGSPIPGYELGDCDRIHTANQINRRVTWHGQGDVARLAGRPVRLQVELRDADLYAFQFRAAAPATVPSP